MLVLRNNCYGTRILKRFIFWILVCVVPLTQFCSKYDNEMFVTTGSETKITHNSTEITGRIVDLGEGATQYGHCYAKTQGVNISDMRTQLGKPTGQISFTSILTDLESETKYYVKAYLSDGNKTVYGEEISFTTLQSPPIPEYVSSVIEDSTPALLEMTYNHSLSSNIPAASAFTVMVNTAQRTVDSVSITGSAVRLTLESAIASGDVVTVAYTRPSINPLQTPTGGLAESIVAQPVTNNVSTTIPVYTISVIENSTPSQLEMSYNIALANIIPATSAFTVIVNSSKRTVSNVIISENKVMLILDSEVSAGDVVTIAYTKPATNPLQTPSGGQAESLEEQPVTNNVSASTTPEYVGSVIEDATRSMLEITYNKALLNVVPATSAFTVMVNSLQRTVISVSITETKVQLSLESEVSVGDVVTLAYTKPATNPLQTPSGGQAESLEVQPVTNNVSASTTPEYVGSVIEDATRSLLEMTFNSTLADIVPDTSAFSVNVNYVSRKVNNVAISGTKVQLTLESDVVFGDVVTVAYTKPASNPLQSLSGNQLESFDNQIVTNNCLTIPILSTDLVFDVTISTAQSGGEIIFDGGASIEEKGVCWSETPNPTITDDISADGSGPEKFTSTLSGLSENTTYYVRGYATNSSGTGYGNEIVFKTYTGIIYDIELNSYFTVTIGTQIWMAENLKVTRLNDGTSISTEEDPKAWYSLTIPAYCWYDNNEAANKDTYGALYNYYVLETNKICPNGWHVPNNAEWEELKNFLGGTNVAGGKMKEAGNIHWTNPNEGATNESGFTALPSGRRVAASGSTTVYSNLGDLAWWWENETRGYSYRVWYSSSELYLSTFGYNFEGLSIRCIKD